ncbi:MAG: hypothetical protein D6712_07995 [Chloroflexi bacterium]|nr:MAG: hypothetical protein D6712_07995 [Chloroflexota bacterium]
MEELLIYEGICKVVEIHKITQIQAQTPAPMSKSPTNVILPKPNRLTRTPNNKRPARAFVFIYEIFMKKQIVMFFFDFKANLIIIDNASIMMR